jgi:hypothetical protein
LNKYIIGLIFILLLINCCAKKSEKNIKPNDSDAISENKQDVTIDTDSINEQLQYVNENYLTFLEIREYIFNDLNIKKFSFSDIDEIKETLKLPGEYKINMKIERMSPHNAVYEIHTFEGSFYILYFYKYDDSNNYYLESMTMDINQDNYLQLFPFRNIEKYKHDDKFGRKYDKIFTRDAIIYGTDSNWAEWKDDDEDPSMVCSLGFINGLLFSISFGRLND